MISINLGSIWKRAALHCCHWFNGVSIATDSSVIHHRNTNMYFKFLGKEAPPMKSSLLFKPFTVQRGTGVNTETYSV
jgi:hypothetical protein